MYNFDNDVLIGHNIKEFGKVFENFLERSV